MTKNPFADTPIAKIKYWRSLPADNIQLGDDVYFECEVTNHQTAQLPKLPNCQNYQIAKWKKMKTTKETKETSSQAR